MAEANGKASLTPRKALTHAIGFGVGLVLLVWCVREALSEETLARLRGLELRPLTILLLCSAISVVANGALFWNLIQPLARLPFHEIQLVNASVNFLNYAPIRLGMVTRVIHHRRVDRLEYLFLAAWYAGVAVVMLASFGAMVAATVLRPSVDGWWIVWLIVLLMAGWALVWWLSSHRLLRSRLQGAERVLSDPWHLTGAMAFRVIDVVAYTIRLYVAFEVMDVELSGRELVYLTVISMLASMSPVGTLGFREFAITFFGQWMTVDPAAGDPAALQSLYAAATLLDRAAEAALFVPLGVVGLIWMQHRWRRAGEPCDSDGADSESLPGRECGDAVEAAQP